MNNEVFYLIMGFLLGMAVIAAALLMPGSDSYANGVAIESCEKDLPRTQTCILTAVPKSIEE